MALLPSTPPSRVVPVAGRQFAERRLMRGVGAAERAVGNAWGRMTSRQREYYGNQRNFASGLQGVANERGAAKEVADREDERQRGFKDATGQSANSRAIATKSAPPAAKTDHSTEVMPTQEELYAQRIAKRRQNEMARMKSENPGRYKRLNDAVETDSGVPRIKPGWQDKPDLEEAMKQGRVGGNRRPDPESAPESAPAAPKPITFGPPAQEQDNATPAPKRPMNLPTGSETEWNSRLRKKRIGDIIRNTPLQRQRPQSPQPGPAQGSEENWQHQLYQAKMRSSDAGYYGRPK